MRPRGPIPVKLFLLALAFYAPLVLAYLWAVPTWLNQALASLPKDSPKLYAVAAMGLVLGQALLLERITSDLVRWLNSRQRG